MKKLFFLTLFLFFFCASLFSGTYINEFKEEILDSVIPKPVLKHYFLSAGEVIGSNILLWAFDRYVVNGDFAYINCGTIKRNLREGFHWDNDNFPTNLFAHAYHGSVYYGLARSNRMNIWQSGLYVLGGSLMWEFFMESELPAINDLGVTVAGGIALGEIFYRLSDAVLDNRVNGWNRFGREFVGLLLSPGKGINRLIAGESWKISSNKKNSYFHPDISCEIFNGMRGLSHINDGVFGLGSFIGFNLFYADFFQSFYTQPYDCFSIHTTLNLQAGQPVLGQFNLLARLWYTTLIDTERKQLRLGIYQHFDYYDSGPVVNIGDKRKSGTPYRLGTPVTLGPGINFKLMNSRETFITKLQVYSNLVSLGSSLCDYSREYKRDYNWGSGYSSKLKLEFEYKNKVSLSLANEFYHLFTSEKIKYDVATEEKKFYSPGEISNAFYNIHSIKIGYHFNKNIGIYCQGQNYFRKTEYDYFPDVVSITEDVKILINIRP